MGRRRRRTKKKPSAPHPPLWPYLVGLAIVLFLGLTLRIRYLERVHAGSGRPGATPPAPGIDPYPVRVHPGALRP